jgi:hypothetical protein
MCKEMDPKRLIGKKWRAEEEERHKGLLTKKTHFYLSPQFEFDNFQGEKGTKGKSSRLYFLIGFM